MSVLQQTRSRLAGSRERLSEASGPPLRAGAVQVGAEIREAREALGWSVEAVAAQLRIRQPYLEAIEAGRVAELPGSAYAVGFLRAYAGIVGLDADALADRFRQGATEVNRRTELAFPAPVPQRGMPAGAVVVLGALVVVAAYAGWYRVSSDGHTPVQTVPEVPEHLASQAAPVMAAPSPQVASILPATTPSPLPATVPPPGAPAPAGAPPVAVAPAVQPQPVQAAAVPAATPAPAAQPVASVPAVAAAGPAAAAPGAVPAGTRIVLSSTAPSWIMVREKGGKVLVNETLHPGETWPVPADEHPLLLSVGNARALTVSVDGVAAPQLQGTSRRDLLLDPAEMQAGKAAAAPVAPKPKPRPAAPAAAPVGADSSADALNARQLGQH
ncbi:MAG: helix-turn-helix domain-containing protein [Janthinobacterium lividum]